MNAMKKYVGLALASVALFAPKVARADPPIGACASALTMVSFPGYVDCKGAFSGNINGSASELTALNAFGGPWAGTWTWDGSSDDVGHGPFTSDPPTIGATGTLTFDSPFSGKFVVGIKQCKYYSWYLFYEVAPISSINVDSRGTCGNDGFSHVGLYEGTGGIGRTLSVTPEPATMTLMATGLVGLVGVGLRRKKS